MNASISYEHPFEYLAICALMASLVISSIVVLFIIVGIVRDAVEDRERNGE